MATKKPWRTLIIEGDTGRFTREQIEAAVQRVLDEKARKAARNQRNASRSTPSS